MLQDKCTILIPTLNRPELLKRLLRYYNRYKCKNKIIVGDSSTPEIKDMNHKTILSMKNIDIIHRNDYNSTISMYNKCLDMLQYCSKYTMITGDDDFFTIKGINEGVKFLEENKNYSGAQGCIVVARHRPGFVFWDEGRRRRLIYSDDPVKRVTDHLRSYIPSFYSVHRTDITRIGFEESNRYADNNVFNEMIIGLMDFVYGNVKFMNVLYGVREESPVPVYSDIGSSNTVLQMINDGTYKDKYPKFKECLVKHLMEVSDKSEDEISKEFELAMGMYMSGFRELRPRYRFQDEDIQEIDKVIKCITNKPHMQLIWSHKFNRHMTPDEVNEIGEDKCL